MNVYLESSAVLRDVLEGERAAEVRSLLSGASVVATSRITLAEVGRVLARLRALEPEVAARIAPREAEILSDSERWTIHPVDEHVLSRCARPFPQEPVRTLDAIHLASIERLSSVLPDLVVLSTDGCVRRNAAALGFAVRP